MYAYIKHAFVSPLLHVPVCFFSRLEFWNKVTLVTVLPSHLQTPWKGLRCFHPSCLGIMSQCLSHILCMFAACWDTLLITTEKPQYNDNLSLHCLISNNLLMQYFRYTFQGLMSSLRYTFINFLITCPGPAVISLLQSLSSRRPVKRSLSFTVSNRKQGRLCKYEQDLHLSKNKKAIS